MTINGQQCNVEYMPPESASALWIPSGTLLSTIIPPGSIIEQTKMEPKYELLYGPCSQFVSEYNNKFWIRNWTPELEKTQLIKDEITYYEQFFQELQNASTFDQKLTVYKDKVYPLLCDSWETFATSGFLSNPELSGLQLYYSGLFPGEKLTQNIGNKEFTTLAVHPNIGALTEVQPILDETSLYLAKPFYENIAYYILLVTKEILNMQDYNINTGFGVPQNGWKQSFIEYKGYNSWYENSPNITPDIPVANQLIDVDGPWVYSVLQKFVKLYQENNELIPYNKIYDFVTENYITIKNENIREITSKQLWKYQKEIIAKQDYKVYEFQQDIYNNQFILYKHNDYCKYEDAGEVWVRLGDYPLAMPLMFYTELWDNNLDYNSDVYDLMECKEHKKYANMMKEIFNNAIQFGVIGNVGWILGYTKYINFNGTIIANPTDKKIKVGCFKFERNPSNGLLTIDISSIRFFGLNEGYDCLDFIDEFVGTYFNHAEESFEIILCHKQTYINSLVEYIIPNSEPKTKYTGMIEIPFRIWKYPFNAQIQTFEDFTAENGNVFVGPIPAFNLGKNKFLVNHQEWKYSNVPSISSAIDEQSIFELINKPVKCNLIVSEYSTEGISGYISAEQVKPEETNYLFTGVKDEKIISGLIGNIKDNEPCLNKNDLTFSGFIGQFNIDESGSFVITDTTELSGNFSIGLWDKFYSDFKLKTGSESPWKINSDYSNVNIAYEAYSQEVSHEFAYRKLFEDDSKDYFIGKLIFTCPLSKTKSGDGIWSTSVDSIKYKFGYEKVSLFGDNENGITDDIGLYMLHNKFPKCTIDTNNILTIEIIGTTLGGNKTEYQTIGATSLLSVNQKNILVSSLVRQEDGVDVIDIPTISQHFWNAINNGIAQTDNNLKVQLSDGLSELIELVSNLEVSTISGTDSIITQPSAWDSWEIPFKNNSYNEWKEFGKLETLQEYNKGFEKLNTLTKFSPSITNCLVEPMKIIFNFGTNRFNFETYFDMDIKVSIDDANERDKAVGWRCGYKSTRYLNWVTSDNRFNGPEIVLVDVETYKIWNPEKTKLTIPINVCWFEETQIESINPTVSVIWRGYEYIIPIWNMEYNSNCCDTLTLNLDIDLITNSINYKKSVIYPVASCMDTSKITEIYWDEFTINMGYIISKKDEFTGWKHGWNKLAEFGNKNYYIYIWDKTSFPEDISGMKILSNVLSDTDGKMHELYEIIDSNDLGINNIKEYTNILQGNWQEEIYRYKKQTLNTEKIKYTIFNKNVLIF